MSIAVIEWSTTNLSLTNRYPIVDIRSFISVEMAFSRLSNVHLQGIVTRSHASPRLRLY